MSELFEELKIYLPKYLSAGAQGKLFKELEQFPENIDARLYTNRLANEQSVFQGDGLCNLWVSNLPDPSVKQMRAMVLSNTCDVAQENKRMMGPRLLYCPIISLAKYEGLIREQGQSVPENHIEDICKQRISSMFFLPKTDALGEAGIALLDRINNCDLQAINVEDAAKTRLFTLSDYGFYLFLFKLSVHLTRIREGIERN